MEQNRTVFFGVAAVLLLLAACSGPSTLYVPAKGVDQRIEAIMQDHNAVSVGIAVIRGGETVWTGYYGESAPGKPVSAQSVFNTASVNKAVTTETALRLVSQGRLDLDEPIAPYYVHPDLIDDPRYAELTPRLLLTHQAGFLNWPFLYDDGKLAFIDEPGNGKYHYAGIGFRIFALFLEQKLGEPFPDIVRKTVFLPNGMERATNSHDVAAEMSDVVTPVRPDGEFTDFEWELDYWSAADDLFVSVEDYARFLIAVYRQDYVREDVAQERSQVQTLFRDDPIWGCGEGAVSPCPEPYGHGVGWFAFGTDAGVVLHHGGNDRSEGAIGYINPTTGDGGVVFVNGARGLEVWPLVVDVVDPDQQFHQVFHDLIRQFVAPKD